MKAIIILLLSVSMYGQVSSDRAVSPGLASTKRTGQMTLTAAKSVEYPDDSLERSSSRAIPTDAVAEKSRPFLALESAMVASAAFDASTTIHNLRNGCNENNPLMGSHPSTARVVAFEAGWTTGELVIAHFLHRHHPKIASLLVGESTIEHGVAGGLNTQQKCF